MHYRTTLNDMIRYQFEPAVEKMRLDDTKELEKSFTTLIVLSDAAEHYQDYQLSDLLDHVRYLVDETMMGARVKAELELPNIEARVKALE